MARTDGLRKAIVVAGVASGVFVLVIAGAVILLGRALLPGPVTDSGRYSEVLAALRAARPGYVAHFPNDIPTAATGVRVYFQQGVLQGSTMFELRMQLPPDEFEIELARAERLFSQRRMGPDTPSYHHFRLFTEVPGAGTPASRRTLLLGAGPGPDVWGISVDPVSNEIAYWMIDD